MPLTLTSDPPFSHLSRRPSNRSPDLMQKGYFSFCPSETWTPSVNLYETDTAYLVCVDLAGVDKEKIDVEVADNQLTLRGTREVPATDAITDGRPRVHLMEIDHGAFSREVELPHDVIKERITARYVDGLLWIELPKK